MSNVSDVTPYDDDVTTIGISDDSSQSSSHSVAAAGFALAARWLAESLEADRAALTSYKERRRQVAVDALLNGENSSLQCTPLHLSRPDTLVQSALGLGYRIQTGTLQAASASPMLLQGPQGQRIAIAPNAKGRISLMASEGSTALTELLSQHTLDRALQHLTLQGMQVRTQKLSNGEVQILACETTAKAGGAAVVKAQIRTNGSTHVDVDNIRGRRCEDIVNGLAAAVGGKASQIQKKSAYFELPGEPAKTHVKG